MMSESKEGTRDTREDDAVPIPGTLIIHGDGWSDITVSLVEELVAGQLGNVRNAAGWSTLSLRRPDEYFGIVTVPVDTEMLDRTFVRWRSGDVSSTMVVDA